MNSSLIGTKLELFLNKRLDRIVLSIQDNRISLVSCGKFNGLFNS